MKYNLLSSLATPEETKCFDKIRFRSLFYPFKQRKLEKVEAEVKKILGGFNINYPIFLNFKNCKELSKYAIAGTYPLGYCKYKIFIHYNPSFMSMEFDQLVFTGLHEYSHFIYQQRQVFSDKLQQIYSNIDYNQFIEDVDYLTEKFTLEWIDQIPSDKIEILKEPRVIEDIFAEGFAGHFFNPNADSFVRDKEYFETIIRTHTQIMTVFRRLMFGE